MFLLTKYKENILAIFKVGYNPLLKSAIIRNPNATLPTGYANIGSFTHDGDEDSLGSHVGHTIFHHVRELLTKTFHKIVAETIIIQEYLNSGNVPVPYFTTEPSIQVEDRNGKVRYLADGGYASDALKYIRRWILNGTAMGSAQAFYPPLAGNLVLEMTAIGPGGSVVSTTAPIAVQKYPKVVGQNTPPWDFSNVGDPTPPPLPDGRATIIYNSVNSQYEVTNYTSFPAANWSWEDENGSLIIGQSDAILSRSAAPAGLYVRAFPNGDRSKASRWCICPINLVTRDLQFTGLPEQKLNGVGGWATVGVNAAAAVTDTDRVIIKDGVVQITEPVFANAFIDLGDDLPKKITIYDPQDAWSGDATQRFRNFFLRKDRSLDTHKINLSMSSGTIQLSRTIAGVSANNGSQTGAAASVGISQFSQLRSVGFSNFLGNGRTYMNDRETAISSAGPLDVSGLPSLRYLFVDFSGSQKTNNGIIVKGFGRVVVETMPAKYFDLKTRTDIPSNSTYPLGAIQFEGVCTSNVSNYDWSMTDRQGRRIDVGANNVALTSTGNWAITVPITDAILDAVYVNLSIRDTNDKNMMATIVIRDSMPLPASVFAIEPLQFGLNGDTTDSATPSDMIRDRGRVVWFRYGASGQVTNIPAANIGSNGGPNARPQDSAVTAFTPDRILAILWQGGGENQKGHRLGKWRIETNFNHPFTLNAPNANVVLSNQTNTGCDVEFIDPLGSKDIDLRWMNPPAPPAEGLKVTCIPMSEVGQADLLITPQFANIYHASQFGGSMWWRDMKAGRIQNKRANESGSATLGAVPEFAAAMANQLGGNILHNWAWGDVLFRSETHVRPYLEAVRDGSPSWQKLCGEVDNEVWEYGDQKYKFSAMHGVAAQMGMVPGVTVPQGVTVQDGYDTIFNTSGVALRDVQAGEWMNARVASSQFVLFECIQDAPAGTVQGTTSTAYFRVAALHDTLMTGALRLQAYIQKKLGLLMHEVLGDRAISVLGANQHGTAAQYIDAMMWDNAWEGIDKFSPSFYYGLRTGWNASSDMAKHTSDFPAFKTWFNARVASSMNDAIANLKRLRAEIPLGLYQRGVPYDRLPKMDHLYEGGDHNVIGGPTAQVPSGDQAGLIAAIRACLRSTEYQAVFAQYLENLRTEIGGVIYWFTQVEPVRYSGVPQMQWFGLREYQYNTPANDMGATELRYQAVRAIHQAHPL